MRSMDSQPNPAQKPFQTLVLAGDRGPDDGVARAAGVCCKALAPVAGRPMVLLVLDALGASEQAGEPLLCGPPPQALEQCPALAAGIAAGSWRWMESLGTPSTSAHAGLQALSDARPVLLTTADHALLRPEIIDHFCRQAAHSDCDLVVGLARYDEVMAAHPGVRRTGLRFSDDRYCGCNLFAFLSPDARRVAEFWRRLEQDRKRPWRLIRALGWVNLLRWQLGRLSLDQALGLLAQRLDLRLGHVLLPFADAAVDVDTPADWEYVRKRLERPRTPG